MQILVDHPALKVWLNCVSSDTLDLNHTNVAPILYINIYIFIISWGYLHHKQ